MRLLFIFPRPTAYNSDTVRQQPMGGTEKAVIFLGEALAKLGHEVEWVTTPDQVSRMQCQLLDGKRDSGYYDAVITQLAFLLPDFPNSKQIWWTHHFSDQPIIQQNAAYGRVYADKIVTLSECHRRDFQENLRLDSVCIGHGIWLDELHTGGGRDPYRLIYASTPFRGLERIPDLFERIRARESRATIAICSSMATYGESDKDQQYETIFNRLANLEGVELLGALAQRELYEQYARASVFFYPCTWRETYCIAMDEAMAHGCVPWIDGIGALPERAMPADFFASYMAFHWNDPDFDSSRYYLKHPQSWLDVARRWESEVLA